MSAGLVCLFGAGAPANVNSAPTSRTTNTTNTIYKEDCRTLREYLVHQSSCTYLQDKWFNVTAFRWFVCDLVNSLMFDERSKLK